MSEAWAILVGLVVAVEVWALLNDAEGDTLSEAIRRWAARHWARRVVVLGILAWLAWHWGLLW